MICSKSRNGKFYCHGLGAVSTIIIYDQTKTKVYTVEDNVDMLFINYRMAVLRPKSTVKENKEKENEENEEYVLEVWL